MMAIVFFFGMLGDGLTNLNNECVGAAFVLNFVKKIIQKLVFNWPYSWRNDWPTLQILR